MPITVLAIMWLPKVWLKIKSLYFNSVTQKANIKESLLV